MALIDRFEALFGTLRKEEEEHVDLKEIFCKRKDDGFIKRVRTAAVGCEYSNTDGSERQDSLSQLKAGEKVRLIWGATGSGAKKYRLPGTERQEQGAGNARLFRPFE